MAEALGVDVRRIYSAVFTLGAVLGTTAGALVVPTAAASLDMAIEFVVEAFAVVVIGGLGSMRGALVGAADRRPDPRAGDRLLSGIRGAGDLRDRHRRPDLSPGRPVREGAGMKAALVAVALLGTVAFALLPYIVPPYYVGLMIPFFGYAIALLGFNLLFGYTGLLSFGHAMFLGIGAYGAAVMTAGSGSSRSSSCLFAVMLASVADRAADRLALRALRRHLLRHADARLRHAVPLVPVQVLLRHRRRQRHARAADENSWAGIRQIQQDRVSGRAVLLLLPRPADHRRFR